MPIDGDVFGVNLLGFERLAELLPGAEVAVLVVGVVDVEDLALALNESEGVGGVVHLDGGACAGLIGGEGGVKLVHAAFPQCRHGHVLHVLSRDAA